MRLVSEIFFHGYRIYTYVIPLILVLGCLCHYFRLWGDISTSKIGFRLEWIVFCTVNFSSVLPNGIEYVTHWNIRRSRYERTFHRPIPRWKAKDFPRRLNDIYMFCKEYLLRNIYASLQILEIILHRRLLLGWIRTRIKSGTDMIPIKNILGSL